MDTSQLAASLKSRTDSKGFTLIELIIVIAIIGILVAIAIPVYGAIQQNARQKALEASAKEGLAMAIIALTDDDPNTSLQTVEANLEASTDNILFMSGVQGNEVRVSAGWSDNGPDMENVEYWVNAIGNF